MKDAPASYRETIWATGVALLTAMVYVIGPFAHRPNGKNILDLVNNEPLNQTIWTIPSSYEEHMDEKYAITIPLFILFFVNFFLGALSLTVAVPCGCILPLLAGGAAFGRAIGEIVQV
jgi:H+/Cl- antiporter ClcA